AADYAARLLRTAADANPPPAADWQARAKPLLAAALVRGKKLGKAARLLPAGISLTRDNSADLLDALLRLTRDPPEAGASKTDTPKTDAALQREAGELLLALLQRVPVDEGPGDEDPIDERSGSDSQAWRLPYRAAALRATSRQADALAAAQRLAGERPDDLQAQQQLAALLATQPGEADRRRALALWRQLEGRSGRGTADWRRARLARIELLEGLGQRRQAAKLLRITRVLNPELGESEAAYAAAEERLATP
ncbi:MAG: hypothetical protein AAF790_09310, partial [Planctomycetota bacterium]